MITPTEARITTIRTLGESVDGVNFEDGEAFQATITYDARDSVQEAVLNFDNKVFNLTQMERIVRLMRQINDDAMAD